MEKNQNIDVQLKGPLEQYSLVPSFTIPMKGFTALFGPSGCCKTSVLRSIAGLNKIPGRIVICTDVLQEKKRFFAPHKRSVGYVFQEPSLFSHLSVHVNLVFGLRLSGVEKHLIAFVEVVQLLGLEKLIHRRPEHLSVGERQRVRNGRSLLV